ncbi:hypothetical protein K458DRAFT_322856 [Lentithecium fluviatile CBS 122367]|uniref:Tudor domain-containing protein n=1 Tax=Lentithecium fluviatile CBS 122367 TaxID=1168545 RepID=A0A6G1ICU2_9PLEO|nr:hypothetical protein K458DRAFT_322856 [Lentithecium fluviatile CBS 122367]
MADDIKQIKNQIWYAKQKVEKEEQERQMWMEQKQNALALLEADPDNDEIRAALADVEEGLATVDASLEPLRAQLDALEAKLPTAPKPVVPKFDPEKHPLLKKTLEKAEVTKPVVLNTGDVCEAQWPADKQWYKAKIKTILGAASAPKYHVLFIDYGDTMTVDSYAVRPIQGKRKREGESNHALATSAASQVTPVTSTPHVISGPASVNPNAQAAKQDHPSDAPEPKKRKIPNKKALEKGVASWKNWNSKGVGKKISQKESMFRSGTTVNSRVGFTGSGAGMTETKQRLRHNNKADADDDGNGNDSNGGAAVKHRTRF